jgi:hypothetical protein
MTHKFYSKDEAAPRPFYFTNFACSNNFEKQAKFAQILTDLSKAKA